ncbi:MAG: aminotransferase class I/II-fold pyridoxal phosphate-dependent enzyme [Microbacteriaceae bacterium]|jgi:aminotransferase|nr:aminotransferase class I/II-fold pyridoxal phosphate-dependent enzyme [Microbacteriaceae bacterium]MCI1207464.1 aminotransferase class I/II-fold pyridoxal phosphate-dependent enzyme [Microbacteriaceae bacterium]
MQPIETSALVQGLPRNFFSDLDDAISALPAEAHVIDASKGNPDLPTPQHIVHALSAAAVKLENQQYPPFLGKRNVRDAIAAAYLRDYGVRVDPETQVTVFHGSHEALMALPQALLNPGDALTVVDPGYPPYLAAAHLARVRVHRLRADPARGFRPELSSVDEAVLADTRLLLLNYPNNPTGALATPDLFQEALEAGERYGFPVVNDFAYASLGFEHQPLSLLQLEGGLRGRLEISTMSKTYSMAGWRFGYAVGDERIIAALRSYQTTAYSTVFGAVQDAAAVALTGDQHPVRDIADEYRARRDLVVAGLRNLGWDVPAPEGTFFVWVKAPGSRSGEDLTRELLERARVAVAPGIGFGPGGHDYVRIGLVHSRATLTEMLDRIRRAGLGRGF